MSNTHITLVVDRSGSMNSCLADAQGGINTLLRDQSDGKTTLLLTEFDYTTEKFYSGQIEKCPTYFLVPRGMTALYDAIGSSVEETEKYLKKIKKPELILFCIVTDGLENCSGKFTKAQNKKIIDTKTKDKWHFTYLCNDPFSQQDAQTLQINSVAQYNNVRSAYSATSQKFSRMKTETQQGLFVNNTYTDEEMNMMQQC